MSFNPESLLEPLQRLRAARYWLGLSGGLDSMVLLHALATQRQALPGELRAVHVNHGLHPDAKRWQDRCGAACAALGVPMDVRQVSVQPGVGESLEAVARDLRYRVFRELLGAGDVLVLAHHQDDQLETFLLQALRGAGARGLSAMPEETAFATGRLLRPLLRHTRAELEAWARGQAIRWIDDPSNDDPGFDRNYLRHKVLPPLRARWPAAAETVSRSARLCAEAAELMDELARLDWESCGRAEALPLRLLESLAAPRARNLLRYWLRQRELPTPPSHKLEEILRQLPARGDRNPCIDWAGAEVRRYRRRLYALKPLPAPPSEFVLRPGERCELGGGLGSLSLVSAAGEGICADLATPRGLRVAFRNGGESCRPAGQAHHRPLKKWLQDLHVVPWLRGSLPLLYADDRLLAVAGLFICEPYAARAGEAGLRVDWRQHPSLT